MAFDLAALRQKLLARRQELLAEDAVSAESRAPVTLEQDNVGRLSRIDAMQLQAMALAQARRRKSERGAIDEALRRMDEGDYGYCRQCGEDIAPARLERSPSGTTCIECANQI